MGFENDLELDDAAADTEKHCGGGRRNKVRIQGRIRHEDSRVGNPRCPCWRRFWRYRSWRWPAEAEAPKKGGILKFVVPDEPPSFDGHKETTFALIHPIAPFYSTLIRVNPDESRRTRRLRVRPVHGDARAGPTAARPTRSRSARASSSTTARRSTAKDVHASFQRIVFPPQGVSSARKAQFSMVESVTAPDDETVVFKLKYPSGAFIPSLATPYNFIYSKAVLDKDQHWYEKNVMGSGPFVFELREAGALVAASAIPTTITRACPTSTASRRSSPRRRRCACRRSAATRRRPSSAAFRPRAATISSPRSARTSRCRRATGTASLLVTPNHKKKPFDDVRVRRALTLAVDRWGGSKDLSKIAIVKAVGGVVFPGHPLATPKAELEKLAGYWPDINKSREEAKRLLKEAGVPDLKFTLANRGVDQPYTIVGTWLIDQWKQVGITVDQKVEATGPFYASLENGELRRDDGLQLPVDRQPAGRHLEVPARCRRPVRQVRGPGADQAVRRHEPGRATRPSRRS